MSLPRRRASPVAAGAALAALIAAFVPAACSVSQVPEEPARPSKVVMGYYRTSSKAVLDHTRIAYEYLTHIAHAFAWPDASGNLVVPAGLLYPELNAAAHASDVKIILSLGGWGNCAGFPGMASTAANRARFIGQLVDFCRTNAYDGVDIDWEFVSNDAEKANFTLFIEALGAALKAQTPPAPPDDGDPVRELLRPLDRLRASGRRLRLHRLHDLRLPRRMVRSLRPQLAPLHAARRYVRLARRDVRLRPRPPGPPEQAPRRRGLFRPVLRLRGHGPAVHDEPGLGLCRHPGPAGLGVDAGLGRRRPGPVHAPDRTGPWSSPTTT